MMINQTKIFWFITVYSSYKTLIGAKILCIRFNRVDGSIRVECMIELDILYYLKEKNMTSFATGLDIL